MKSVCVGDNVIDYYVNDGRMFPGGNSLNVAVHLARLGSRSAYLGNIGDDEMAQVILRSLRDNGVEHDHCQIIPGASTKHCNYTVTDGERSFVSVELGDRWSGPMELTEDRLDYLKEFDVIISNCNAKMQDEMKKISATDRIYVYDFGEKPKYHVDEYLDLVCENLDLAMFSFPLTEERELREFADRIMAHGCRNVLITMGSHGQYLINERETVNNEIRKVAPVDTMGAGDAFLAAFVFHLFSAGWRKGESLPAGLVSEALARASQYAAENCLKVGGFGEQV